MMKQETLIISYTCGVCETICNEQEMSSHSCLEGYNHCQVDENLYFYPQTDDGQIIRESLVNDSKTIVMKDNQVPNKETENNWRNKKVTEEERLIEEIHKRPPLWNFKLPLTERSLRIKNKLWEEVAALIDGKMDVSTIKKRWKSLCDTFRVHHKSKQQQSSSARTLSRKEWIHYKQMQFLCDMQLESETVTNISATKVHNIDQCIDNETMNDTISNCSESHSRKRYYSEISDSERHFERLTEILSHPITVNLPTTNQDKISAFGNLVVAHLREMNPQLTDDVMLKIMQVINNAKKL
ncbi:uncharacterized protein LOC105828309 [Monomorium pharaonis]|uniref:uncharacterized protein LOC105828309 n=1 Tax=Monomorium pharaonis TaxID=307658 RepID=UPI00102E10D8|nr:uncharacterized protein LOC105828309 [Monomorium pharaonis]